MRRIIFLAALAIVPSCYHGTSNDVNENFANKYGKEIVRLNTTRTPTEQDKKEVIRVTPPSHEEWLEVTKQKVTLNNYTYSNSSSVIGEDRQYLAEDQYDLSRVANAQNMPPSEMFKPRYVTVLHSKFRQIGAEFDGIVVPYSDAHGVKQNLSQKSYLMVGRGNLLESVDQISDNRSKRDIEISKILIDEQNQLRIERRKGFKNDAEEEEKEQKDEKQNKDDLAVADKKDAKKKGAKTIAGSKNIANSESGASQNSPAAPKTSFSTKLLK